MEIYENSLIWKSGWDDWKKAHQVEELTNTIILQPPPTPLEKEKHHIELKNSAKLKRIKKKIPNFLIYGIIIGLILNIVYYDMAKVGGSNLHPIYLTKEEQNNLSLIFWNQMPFSLLLGCTLSFFINLVSLLMSKNIEIEW